MLFLTIGTTHIFSHIYLSCRVSWTELSAVCVLFFQKKQPEHSITFNLWQPEKGLRYFLFSIPSGEKTVVDTALAYVI